MHPLINQSSRTFKKISSVSMNDKPNNHYSHNSLRLSTNTNTPNEYMNEYQTNV